MVTRRKQQAFSCHQVEPMGIEVEKRKGGENEGKYKNNWVEAGVNIFHSRVKENFDYQKRRKN